jgi:hypothetical protein
MRNKYALEKYSGAKSRFTCPDCNKPKEFTRYINVETNEYLDPLIGRCNREGNCGYHYTPKDYFRDHNLTDDNYIINYQPTKTTYVPKVTSYISTPDLESTLANYEENKFIHFLKNNFPENKIKIAIESYFIGTMNNPWKGSTVFWQIDINGRIRTGKIMLYDSETGSRVKELYSHLTWYHSIKKEQYPDFNLGQCLFGEHLLQNVSKPVAIVESEKTAIICSLVYPDHLWLATGGVGNLKENTCKPLIDRTVILFPDSDAVETWTTNQKTNKNLNNARISTMFSNKDISGGIDLADIM